MRAIAFLSALLLAACDQGSATPEIKAEPVEVVRRLPDFSVFKDATARKAAFFNFLRPIIEDENRKVEAQRNRMLGLRARLDRGETLPEAEASWLLRLAEEYQVEMSAFDDEQAWRLLRRRVDTVPYRLALAQAASESAWGSSRFAREGLNLFGQWCFTTGCGMVPAQRLDGMRHEVAKYASVNESVAAYIRSINRVHMYTPLRQLRRLIRTRGERPAAVELAQELSGYSERGEQYVKEIQTMIRVNYDLMSGGFTVAQEGI